MSMNNLLVHINQTHTAQTQVVDISVSYHLKSIKDRLLSVTWG